VSAVAAISAPRPTNLYLGAVCLYFLGLSIDLIHIDIGVFKLKLSHLCGAVGLLSLLILQRKIELHARYYFSFLAIFASMLISSFQSPAFSRSIVYCFVWAFTFFSFFAVPVNMMKLLDADKVLKIYIATYGLIGGYAFCQLFFSVLGIELPFSVQNLGLVRGSALAHEPSFYALYAIPFVAFLNARFLLAKVCKDPTLRRKKRLRFSLFCNFFLLVSTTTTAFISYFVFFLVVMGLPLDKASRRTFQGLRRQLMKYSVVFGTFFMGVALLFLEFFKKTFLKFIYQGLIHESFMERWQGIVSAVKVFLAFPLLGVGMGGIGPYLFKNHFFPAFDGSFIESDRGLFETYEPSNVMTEILGSLGLVGLLVFVLFMRFLLKPIKRLAADPRVTLQERINLLAFLISILVMVICLQINQGLFRSYIWVHLGLGVGYAARIAASLKHRPEASTRRE
jgi:hypothetical protein